MSYKVQSIPKFEKELKRLARKYPSLKNEYLEFIQNLKQQPEQGSPLGNNCFKIRLSIASKGKGKSGGGRIITFVKVLETIVYLLTIYDKSEKENINDKDLEELLKWIPE